MTFRATLKKSSWLYKLWKNEGRIGGIISDVPFMWNGQNYVADDPLPADAVIAFQHNSLIELSVSGLPTPVAKELPPVEVVPPHKIPPEYIKPVVKVVRQDASAKQPTLTLPKK